MNFLKNYGFLDSDIAEVENNTPLKIQELLKNNQDLVESNLGFLQGLNIATYKEIFINYPDMFLMDSSNFEHTFNQYDKQELIDKLNNNFKMVKFL